jgi:CRISPR-associated endonuclease/helicase Cas3
MHTLDLQAADSRYAHLDELHAASINLADLPDQWRPMAHQAQTIYALRHGDAPIIINQAMTGDGKSFAAQFMAFDEGVAWRTFIMYPTKELARDQEGSLHQRLAMKNGKGRAWGQKAMRIKRLDADELDRLQDEWDDSTRVEELLRLIQESDLLLTNPDIFHYMIQFIYQRYGKTPDLVLGALAGRFRLFVFDEFHLFGAAETAAVMTAIALIRAIGNPDRPPRFLFLSATPQPLIHQLAQSIDVSIEVIQGSYREDESGDYRRILQPIPLHLHTGDLETWVDDHLDHIIAFFTQNRPTKGVIIANSVASAERVSARIAEPCKRAGIDVGKNTGMQPVNQRGRLDKYDLIVATSTIDVGVDFRVNFLVFESVDANSHMQRLGRLGRHETDAGGNRFSRFEAHALLPDWVVTGIQNTHPHDSELSRSDYRETLDQYFKPNQDFPAYRWHWAGIQAGHVLNQLRRWEIRSAYEQPYDGLIKTYQRLYGKSLYKYQPHKKDPYPEITAAAQSFRGGSPFMALIFNHTAETPSYQPYNLIPLLRDGELIEIGLDKLPRNPHLLRTVERTQPLAAYELRGWRTRAQPRKLTIWYDQPLPPEDQGIVVQRYGFHLQAEDAPPGMSALNKKLETRELAALFVPYEDPYALRQRLRLGWQLNLFPFTSRDNIQGTVAFGRDALLLHSAVQRLKPAPNADQPIIC